jgi:DMSO/TMAO reductase YedYZ molybdopterin-dependent catalytic subunit
VLGIALGVSITICFATGLLSHLIQDPPSWFEWPSRPAGTYRFTQGLHVATGIATIPLLLAKLWVVLPKLFVWPPFESFAHALERLSLLPLVGGSLFMLSSGIANIAQWYPWPFAFRSAHYAVAWITMGGLVVHLGAKASTTRGALRHRAIDPALAADRRAFLGAVAATSGLVTLFSVGQTVRPLAPLALLAPRRPDSGPQGFPVNRSAHEAGVVRAARDPGYQLVVDGRVRRELRLSLADLRAMPQHSAELPIACVEGWSTSQRWSGIPVRALLERAGAPPDAEVTVHSLQRRRSYRTSELNHSHAHDPDTLLALDVNGEELHLEHGYPVRLIGPNRPGVMQTKWVARLEVR